jgi:hypothetical protein
VRHVITARVAEKLARLALEGVGDARLGEWVEHRRIAVHVRRRLTLDEALVTGPVVDVRGTPEARQRYDAAATYLSPAMLELAAEEL